MTRIQYISDGTARLTGVKWRKNVFLSVKLAAMTPHTQGSDLLSKRMPF